MIPPFAPALHILLEAHWKFHVVSPKGMRKCLRGRKQSEKARSAGETEPGGLGAVMCLLGGGRKGHQHLCGKKRKR